MEKTVAGVITVILTLLAMFTVVSIQAFAAEEEDDP